MLHVLFTHSFTFKKAILKVTEYIGVSNQTYDFAGHRIFEVNDITYVAYDHPLVTAKVLFDPVCESDFCNLDILKEQILTNLSPAISFQEIDISSPEGARLANETDIKAVPSFIFDEEVQLLGNFAFIEDFFVERRPFFLLKTPPGKFIRTPHEEVAHMKGAEEPVIIITEFSSFTCSFCKELNDTIDSLMKSYGSLMQVRFIHFNRGGIDQNLIQAAECSAEQGKFWEMHDKLFDNQAMFIDEDGEFNLEFIAEVALELELNKGKFAKCMNDEERFTSRLQGMQRVSADYSIQAAPSFFINDYFHEGSLDKKGMREIINEMLSEPAEDVRAIEVEAERLEEIE